MVSNIYIIGNGFDRYHSLDTRYQAFAFFLQDNYEDIHDDLVAYYGLPFLDRDDPECLWDPLWADFEKALADLDFETVLDDNRDLAPNPSSEDFRDRDWHSYEIEMETIVDRLTSKLCEAFRKFILSVSFLNDCFDKVVAIEPYSVFLSFNYTNTLERYYGINSGKILYIHGNAENGNDKIILGHGFDPDSFKPGEKQPPAGLTDEELQEWYERLSDESDYSYQQAEGEILSYFGKSHKSTDEIIVQNSTFFNSIAGVNKIFILGHSLAEVDQPYFRKVIDSVKNSDPSWIISYYSDRERDSHLETLVKLGIRNEKIVLIKIDSLKVKQPELFPNP